ncbi:MAG: hypothetical protein P9E88_14850 [Candidatus Competibacter sp.]|nr:hypothetical protein [Candidatus Competibacter sp.]
MASQFDAIMAQTGLPALRRAFGEPVVYSGSVDVTTWAMVSRNPATVGQFGELIEARITAEIPLADVPDPQPGDTLELGDVEYRVDQVSGDDGYMVTVVLRAV